MQRDEVVVAKDYILSGDEVGVTRVNDNQVFVGASGAGKSTSAMYPTLFRLENSNPIISFAKEHDAYRMGAYLAKKGYRVDYMNLIHPERSTAMLDCMDYVKTQQDVSYVSSMIMDTGARFEQEPYWTNAGKGLLRGLMDAIMLEQEKPSMVEVLELFDLCVPRPRSRASARPWTESSKPVKKSLFSAYSLTTDADDRFSAIKEKHPDSVAVREYTALISNAEKTAGCVRDVLAATLNFAFSEDIRNLLLLAEPIDLERFANEKSALIMITSGVDTSKYYYANMVSSVSMTQFLNYAESLPGGCLPRPIRYFFDDFACTAPISGFDNMISRFRSCGISALMLLQSESQLQSIYTPAQATTILNNCSVYCYMPGGMDLATCRNVAEKMDLSLEDVMYAPVGKVFVMQGGRRPVIAERYPTLETEEYRQYIEAGITGTEMDRNR